MTLISDSGCSGLTDNHLVEGKGLWLFFFSLSEIHYGFILFSICERFGNGNIYNSFRYIVKILHYTVYLIFYSIQNKLCDSIVEL